MGCEKGLDDQGLAVLKRSVSTDKGTGNDIGTIVEYRIRTHERDEQGEAHMEPLPIELSCYR